VTPATGRGAQANQRIVFPQRRRRRPQKVAQSAGADEVQVEVVSEEQPGHARRWRLCGAIGVGGLASRQGHRFDEQRAGDDRSGRQHIGDAHGCLDRF
jgi:hypothetical protein